MEKRFFKTSCALIFIFILLISCKERQRVGINEALYYAENIKPIKDSIIKSKYYNSQLVVCSLKKIKGFNRMTLSYPSTPYLIHNKYYYKSFEGVNVLFINYYDTVIDFHSKEEIQDLIDNNIVTFEGPLQNLDPPFLRFVFCQNNYNNITCFDNIMQDSLDQKCLEEDRTYNEMMFYPTCEH